MNIAKAIALFFASAFPYIGYTAEQNNAQEVTPKVKIEYRNQNDCSFMYSPINFCDAHHIGLVKDAILNKKPNFNEKYILLKILERPKYHQYSIVAINPNTGYFYPIPIDSFSGLKSNDNSEEENDNVTFSIESNKVCIKGDILVYKSIKTGRFCFFLEGEKFTGHHTTYMD